MTDSAAEFLRRHRHTDLPQREELLAAPADVSGRHRRPEPLHRMLTPLTRRRRAVVMLAFWTQGCLAYGAAPSNTRLTEWRQVRVRSAEPFPLKVATQASTLVTACRTSEVEGRVRRVAGDTLVLTTSRDVAMAPEPSGRPYPCLAYTDVTLLVTPAMTLEAQQVDGDRTIAMGIALSFAAFGLVMNHKAHTPPPPVYLQPR